MTVSKGKLKAKMLEYFRAGPGKGIEGVPEEVMIEPIPETEWEALRVSVLTKDRRFHREDSPVEAVW